MGFCLLMLASQAISEQGKRNIYTNGSNEDVLWKRYQTYFNVTQSSKESRYFVSSMSIEKVLN